MARIVIDARRLRSTTGRYARELLIELEELDPDHDFHVIVHDEDRGLWTPSRFTLHSVPHDWYSFGEQLGLAAFLRRLQPDLVHFTMPQQPILYGGNRVTTVQDLTLLRFKTGRSPLYSLRRMVFRSLLKNVTRRSRLVMTPSEHTERDVVRFAGLDRANLRLVHYAAFALPVAEAKPVAALAGRRFIFHVGNAFPHKNLSRLLDAHQRLLESHPDLYLALVGRKDVYHDRLERYAAGREAEQFLHLGYVTDRELIWLYRNAGAYVFPSLSEGFGMPGLEAMQYGTPLVSSNATCLPEVYGDAAHFFDPRDTADIARAIGDVLSDPDLRRRLITAGTRRVAQYSWSETARRTYQVYEEALA